MLFSERTEMAELLQKDGNCRVVLIETLHERKRKHLGMISRIAGCSCMQLQCMPIQYELRRLFYLMNIQTHQNSTPKISNFRCIFQQLITLFKPGLSNIEPCLNVRFFHFLVPVGYSKGQSACVSQKCHKERTVTKIHIMVNEGGPLSICRF